MKEIIHRPPGLYECSALMMRKVEKNIWIISDVSFDGQTRLGLKRGFKGGFKVGKALGD